MSLLPTWEDEREVNEDVRQDILDADDIRRDSEADADTLEQIQNDSKDE